MPPKFQSPSGTRDFYPLDLAKRRYIEHLWRTTSIRHGFDEIDGPTFESTDLYAVKSGDGILSEIFQTFSGKDDLQRKAAADGKAPFALRPEFTPTLARMYAARAAQLPKPTKWFWQSTCFRAEKPQRGRLREFLQWNCDILGDDSPMSDVEIIATCVGLLEDAGLTPTDLKVRYSHRKALGAIIEQLGIDHEHQAAAFVLLDRREKLENADLEALAFEFGITSIPFLNFLKRPRGESGLDEGLAALPSDLREQADKLFGPLIAVQKELAASGLGPWCELDLNIARGLAYYTGMVFEVHEISGAMRAVAGGGRYDTLIETFGGPPTPAVGFGMGDVVLSLVLTDRNLMPDDRAISRTLSLQPDVFVLSNGTPEADALIPATVGQLRSRRLHVRRSYKATKNIGKLLKDAADCDARFAVIIESADEVTIKDLTTGTQNKGPRAAMLATII